MQRTSPVHYIDPSAISVIPNANNSTNDLAVDITTGARIKVYSHGIQQLGYDVGGNFQEWALAGLNRRLLADHNAGPADKVPYTIYARLLRTDKEKGYLTFAPQMRQGTDWIDKYPCVTTEGLSKTYYGSPSGKYWYIRLGEVSLPDSNGKRSVDLDTGILGTDIYNSEWSFDPDQMPLRIDITCTIDNEDAGPKPYVPWGKTLVLLAGLLEGWAKTDVERFDHWTISRNSGDSAADTAWNIGHASAFSRTGTLQLAHTRGADDDFNGAVSTLFTVSAWERNDAYDPEGVSSDEPEFIQMTQTAINIMAETVEKFELSLSTNVVGYNPTTDTYTPGDGIDIRIRATDQRSDVFDLTLAQLTSAQLHVSYATVDSDIWTDVVFSGVSAAVAVGNISVAAFAAQKSIVVQLARRTGTQEHPGLMELTRATVAYVRDGEDSRDREWIFHRTLLPDDYGTLPSLINVGEVNPEGHAAGGGTPYDPTLDEWVPQGWWDEQQGVDEVHLYEYGSYRDYIRNGQGDGGQWGPFTTPRIWGHWGDDAVTYDVVPDVSVVNADSKGTVTSDGIVVRAYRTKGTSRSSNILPDPDIPQEGDYYFAEYSIDGKSWTPCVKFLHPEKTSGGETVAVYRYGVESAVVKTARESVSFRLKHTLDASVTLSETTPIKVLRIITEEETRDIVNQYGTDLFLSKLNNDTAQGVITFLRGLISEAYTKFGAGADFGDFLTGYLGYGTHIDEHGNIEATSLTLRSHLEVPKLVYNHVDVRVGDEWQTNGAGDIESVEVIEGTDTGIIHLRLLKDADGNIKDYGTLLVNDKCKGIYHNLDPNGYNDTVTADNGKGGRTFAGFFTSFFVIKRVEGSYHEILHYELRPTITINGIRYWMADDNTSTGVVGGFHPCAGMTFAQYSNAANAARQSCQYRTTTYTRMLHNMTGWDENLANIGFQIGNTPLIASAFPTDPKAAQAGNYSMWIDGSIIFSGTLQRYDSWGRDIADYPDQGDYNPSTEYHQDDLVHYDGIVWRCIVETAVGLRPDLHPEAWIKWIYADSVNPLGHWKSDRVPYPAKAVVNLLNGVYMSKRETSNPPLGLLTTKDGEYITTDDGGYIIADSTLDDDWGLLIDIGDITNGEDGENSVSINLTNDTDTVLTDEQGNIPQGTVLPTTTAQLYDGLTRVTQNVTWSIQSATGCTARINATKGLCEVLTMTAASAEVVIIATYKQKTYGKKFTFRKLFGKDKLWLDMPDVVYYDNDIEATGRHITPESLTIKAYITSASKGTATAIHGSENCGYVRVGGSSTNYYHGDTVPLSWSSFTNGHLIINLYDASGDVQDTEDIRLIQAPPTMTGNPEIKYAVSSQGTMPPDTGWQASIPQVQKGQWLWQRAVIVYTDGHVETRYSVSYQGKDGDGFTSAGRWTSSTDVKRNSLYRFYDGIYVALQDIDHTDNAGKSPVVSLLTDKDGNYITDKDGNYIIVDDTTNSQYFDKWVTDGDGVLSVSRQFAISNVDTIPSENIEPSHQGDWTDESPAVTEQYPYLWAKETVTYKYAAKTTKYYFVGGRGDNGVDAKDAEWVYVRTTENVAPVVVAESGNDYLMDDYCPLAQVSSGRIKGQTEANENISVRCTDDPQGVDGTWKYEWETKRTKGAADTTTGKREWNAYEGEMTLHNNYAESALVIEIDNDSDQFGTDSESKVILQQVRETNVIMLYGTSEQDFTSAPTATMKYDDGTSVASSVATATVTKVTNRKYKISVTIKATPSGTSPSPFASHNGIYVDITGVCAQGTKTIRFTLGKVMGGAAGVTPVIYQLAPSNKVFSFARDASNNLTPPSASSKINISKTEGNTTSIISTAQTGITYKWGWDDSATVQETGKAVGTSITVSNTQASQHSKVWVELSTGDRETLPIVKDGANGTSPWFADLDNEMDSIACDANGHPSSAQIVQTKASMFKGSERQQAAIRVFDNSTSGAEYTSGTAKNGITATWNNTTGIITFTFAKSNSVTFNGRKVFCIEITSGTQVALVYFIVNGIRAAKDGENAVIYQAIPSVSEIVKKKDGTVQPSGNVTCSVTKNDGGANSTPAASEYTLKMKIDGGTEQSYGPVSADSVSSEIMFILYDKASTPNVIDRETVPVVEDGTDGEGFTTDGRWTSSTRVQKNHLYRFYKGIYVAKEDIEYGSSDPETVNVSKAPVKSLLLDKNGRHITDKNGNYIIIDADTNTEYFDLWVADGMGENSIRLDLDNENDSMLYDNNGVLLSGNCITNAKLFDGNSDVTDTVVFTVLQNDGATVSVERNKITVTEVTKDATAIVIGCSYKGNTYVATLSIKRLVDVDKFDIILSENSVAYNTSTKEVQTGGTLSVEVWCTPANGGSRFNVQDLAGYGLTLECVPSSIIGEYSGGSATITVTPAVAEANTHISLSLMKGNEAQDAESIPVVKAKNGDNSILLALDNEHEDFLYSESGLVAPIGGATSQARLYNGTVQVTSGITWAISCDNGATWVSVGGSTSGNAVANISNTGLLTVTAINIDSVKIIVRATYNELPYYAEFTANKNKQDKYDMVVDPSSLAYNSETYTTKTISVYANRTDLQGNTTRVPITFMQETTGLKLYSRYVRTSGASATTEQEKGGTTTTPSVIRISITKDIVSWNDGIYLELRLYTAANTYKVVDYETIEIAKAENGDDAVTYDLVVSPDVFAKNADGSYKSSTYIYCKVFKTVGETRTELTGGSGGTFEAEGLTFACLVNSMEDTSFIQWVNTSFRGTMTTGITSLRVRVKKGNNIILSKDVSMPYDGAAGGRGAQGLQGCSIRISEWRINTEYRNDEGSSSVAVGYIDIVAIENAQADSGYDFYQCKISHSSSNSNRPSSTENKWWKPLSNVGPLYTSLLIAKNAYIKFGTGNEFRIMNANGIIQAGMRGGTEQNGGIRIWAGNIYDANNNINLNLAPFRVTQEGKLYSTDADVTGKITATSGTIGGFTITDSEIKSTNNNLKLNSNGSATIGKLTVNDNGALALGSNVTIDSDGNFTANDGTFKGVLKAEKGITYKVTKFDFTNSSLTKTMSNTDVIASCYTNAISQAATLFLPPSPLDGQMVYVNNIIAGNEWVVIKSGVSGRGIYPSSFLTDGSIKLNRNASVSLVYDNQRNQWWVFSANNT